MNWVKQNLEKTFLLAALLLLAIVSLVMAFSFSPPPALEQRIMGGEAQSTDLSPYTNLVSHLAAIEEWKQPDESLHRLFISRKIEWLRKEQRLKVYDPLALGDDKISRIWKDKWGFSQTDPNVQYQDPDKDLFNNKEEYLSNTNPLDSNDKPPYHVKLRLTDYKSEPYVILFSASYEAGGERVFQINLRNPRPGEKRSNSVKKGEKFADWIVRDYREKKGQEENPATKTVVDYDRSELDIINSLTQQKVTLVLKQPMDLLQATATLLFTLNNTKIPISVGRTFSLKYENYSEDFKVESITSEKAEMTGPISGKVTVFSNPE